MISVKKPPNDTLGLTNMPSGPMDSDVDSLRSTQTSVMRVTEGLARFGTKRYADGMDVDGDLCDVLGIEHRPEDDPNGEEEGGEMELASMPKKERTESNDKRILKLPKDCPAEAVLKTDSPCSVIR